MTDGVKKTKKRGRCDGHYELIANGRFVIE
jgi:hypothetical protein